MAIIVNTNIASIKTQNNLNKATSSMNQALERMSTGYKINHAKDDAAGMFIATRLNVQISGSKAAQTNIETANNVLSTIEGDLDVITSNLNRIRDLTVQASNAVYDDKSIKAMTDEIDLRFQEITRIAKASNFNGLQLLDGTETKLQQGLRVQVGANSGEPGNKIGVSANVFVAKDAATLGLDKDEMVTAFATATTAAAYIDIVDTAIETVSTAKAEIGAVQSRLDSAAESLTTTIENTTASYSTIMDADIAEESAEFTKQQILQQSSAALLVQANQLPALALQLIQ